MTQTVTTLANGDKQIVITGSAETWVFPADWNDNANKFEGYGAGGNGANGSASQSGGGGGGGDYQKIVNFPLQRYANTPNFIDGQATAIIYTINTTNSGTGFTFFTTFMPDAGNTTAIYTNTIGYYPGASAITTTGGAAAAPASSTVQVYYGGSPVSYSRNTCGKSAGGDGRVNSAAAGGGGGGAGGPNGVGGNGGTNTATLGTTGRGGGGGNGGTAGSSAAATAGTAGTGAGAGGAGGAASTSGSAGDAGTNVATTYVLSGGGGGGAGDGTTTTVGGAGGLYGAGGGGGASSAISTRGLGSSGALVITYTPLVANKSNFFMLF